jgi:DNA mismatch endonuclease (patch repair protein)
MDHLTRKKRSWNMSLIKSKNTGPERQVCSLLRRIRLRYTTSPSGLPGKPDILLPKYNAAILVHGCFWHGHKGCGRANSPKSNQSYWLPKIQNNIKRDRKNLRLLKKAGWRPIVIWECRLKAGMLLIEKKLRRHCSS